MIEDHNNNPEFGLPMGEYAPDFSLIDLDGVNFNLKSEYSKGAILLNFFRGHF